MVSPFALLAITGVITLGIGILISLIGSMVGYTISSKHVMEIENNRLRENLNATAIITNATLTRIDVESNWMKSSIISAIMIEDIVGNDLYICKIDEREERVEPLSSRSITIFICNNNTILDDMSNKRVAIITELGNTFLVE